MNLRGVVALLLAAPLIGNAGMPKQLDTFAGLIPAGFVVKDATQPVTAAQLHSATVAIVASANFDNMTKMWVDYDERGGRERQAKNLALLGVALGAGGMASAASGVQQGNEMASAHGGVVRDASDPRNVSDKLVAALTPYCGKLIVATDFASALEQKADYIALIDFYGRFYPPAINTRYRSDVSLQLLDPTLQRVLLAPGHAELDREGDSMFSSPGNVIKGTAATFAKGVQIPLDQTLAALREKLGPPPAPVPVANETAAPPAAESPMAQCIALCKVNTSRTSEQCFDSCNK
jgi:F0F1-type ATP synthase membrane subunit c/vacuolar-type H+-ATPase subunit K